MKICRNLINLIGVAILFPTIVFAGTLADTPLSLKGGVPPNVMFALSVEFPTAVTAAYQDTAGYSPNNNYLGYFDSDKCYTYDTTNGWFAPSSVATGNHICSATWSGNLLNWASMTGLDEFRYAMTGGNRVQDTATLTVLERSYISSQGNTGYFPQKTYTEDGNTTPYPSASVLKFDSAQNGSTMVVSPSPAATDVATCGTPTLVGATFSCGSISLNSDGTTATCTTMSGSGTSASPYKCTAFSSFGSLTASSTSGKTKSTAASAVANTAVSCTSPSLSPTPFSCTLTMTGGHTGTCSTWMGTGTSGSPYTCSAFGVFSGNETFSPSGGNTASSFSAVVTGAQATTAALACTVNANPGNTAAKNVICTMPNGDTATCTSFGSKDGNNKYPCTSFGFTNGGSASTTQTYVSSAPSGTATTTINSKKYYNTYTVTYAPLTTSTIYYISSYPGTDTVGYYYYSDYNLTFGTVQTFNVRVKVCDTTVGQESNCKQFGTSWKPTGVIQDNGDLMRFGVTSYFLANDIDNAVLRSKLKYVAPTKYSSAGTTVTNANTEWSATDGTLIADPDASDAATKTSFIGTATKTGVINYLNKFGSIAQTYKGYDPIGKLYYETLKYLRHQGPTTAFYNGAKSANAEGFPVITTWDDPVLYSCQKNYIIAMGDSNTHCDKRLPGDTHTANGGSQCNAYTDGNGNAHASDFGSLNGDTGFDVAASTNVVGQLEGMGNIATSYTGSGSAGSYAMGGMAGWAASHDIRSDLAGTQTVQSMVIDVQEGKTCSFQKQFWLAAKYGNPASYDTSGNWLTSNNPSMYFLTLPASACNSNSPTGYNNNGGAVSWPKNLLRAGDPQSMIASVKNAVATIVAQIGDEAALAQSSGTLDTGTGAYIYRASYNSGGWQGDVQALSIDTNATIGSTPSWKASSMLPAHGSRNIFTFNDGLKPDGSTESTANARKGVIFNTTNFTNLSTAQQALLNGNEFGTADSLGTDRVNWLRGDQSKEAYTVGTTTPNPNSNNGWRSRASLLGDIINSNPIFVGKPSVLSGTGFATFANTNKNRTPMIYVGGNDGMLHGYDASYTVNANGTPATTSTSGKELFAYVPSAVYKNLSKLMSPNYSHKYYVDGSPTVADACFGNSAGTACTAATSWKTMLVGGLNAGGQGMYALDVTNPSAFDATKVLWEFTDKDDADLGFTFSKPIVRLMNNKKWAVIFGSGYNNTYADSNVSSTGRAYLYILYVDGPGNGNPWVLNTNYFKIPLISPSEGTLPLSPSNGLSDITGIDRDQNGTVDFVYAGDRQGHIWKIDLSSATTSSWKTDLGTAAAPTPLFSATTSGAAAQQITTGLEVAVHPKGGYMVLFGTGSWIDVTDPVGPFTSTDTFYGIWDKDDHSTTVTRSSLQQQKAIVYIDSTGAACTAGAADCFAVMSTCQPNYTSGAQTATATALCPTGLVAPANTTQQLGWYFDLPTSGERTHSDKPKLNGSVVTFTTLSPASDPCSGNTAGMEYNLSFLTGGAPTLPIYAFAGNSTGFIQTTTIPGYAGQSISVVVVGKSIAGGASDNPITFNAKPPSSIVTLPTGIPSPPSAACTGTACTALGSTYIPGWGFLMNMQGSTSAGSKYIYSCHPPEFGNGLPICEWKYKNGQFGRLGWKQINR